jgi:hypothetical protein
MLTAKTLDAMTPRLVVVNGEIGVSTLVQQGARHRDRRAFRRKGPNANANVPASPGVTGQFSGETLALHVAASPGSRHQRQLADGGSRLESAMGVSDAVEGEGLHGSGTQLTAGGTTQEPVHGFAPNVVAE